MMPYNNWKLMSKIDVAVKTAPGNRTFTGYVVEHDDKKGLESAKSWAYEREYDREKREYTTEYPADIHTFDNGGFTVKILRSAGGSSQGGRLSFLACEVEKDGIKFVVGVNDALLVDLIRNSHIDMGVIQEKVMFVRKGGVPGFIHEGMEAYREAQADMKQKSDLKLAKKTKKWEIGGVYSTLTQTDICLGEVWDTMEEYEVDNPRSYYRRVMNLRKRENPVKVTAWARFYNFNGDKELSATFEQYLKDELKDRYYWFSTGTPPARAKASQLEVKESDYTMLDRWFTEREDQGSYSQTKFKGRYKRVK